MPSLSAEERQLLDNSLQDFLAKNYSFERWKKLARGPEMEGFGRAEWAKYAELGWLGVALPESAGGAGGGMTELGIVMAGAGRHIVLEPLLGTIVLGAGAIELAGTAAQRETLLPQLAAGKHLMAFCHAEPGAGYARDYVQAVARPDGSGFVVDGEKTFALGAHTADTLIVSARLGSDKGPVCLFLVPRSAGGVQLNVAPALDGRLGATTSLAGVQVAAGARLGDAGEDMLGVIDRLIDRGAVAVCAEACGAMAAVTQATVEYLKTRQQFGHPLSKFQVLQHRLVDMSVFAEEARAVVHAALQALDDNAPGAQRAVWAAKVQTARSARFVGGQAIQLHGGIGHDRRACHRPLLQAAHAVRDAVRRRRVVPEANRCRRGIFRGFLKKATGSATLSVEPNILEAPIVIDAVLVLHVPLHVGVPTGVGGVVRDNRVGNVLSQLSFDLPDQLLSLVPIRFLRLFVEQPLDLGIAVLSEVVLRLARVVFFQHRIRDRRPRPRSG